jgi:hypothetical protein
MHQDIIHQLIKPANSSHKNLLSQSKLGPYTLTKAQEKPSSTFRNEQSIVNSPHTQFSPQPSYPT